jgi:hypothetical protein
MTLLDQLDPPGLGVHTERILKVLPFNIHRFGGGRSVKIFLIIFVFCVGIASADTDVELKKGLTPLSSKAVYEVLKKELVDAYKHYLDARLPYGYPNFQPTFKTNIESADVDLGLDMPAEASIVRLDVSGLCGSRGCTTYILLNNDGDWKRVYSGHSCDYKILDFGSNGLRDVVAKTCTYKNNFTYHLKYNGRRYIAIEIEEEKVAK